MNTFAKRAAAAAMSMVMLFSFSSCGKADEAAPEETASARVTVDGTKFMVDGKELWINGCNTPWHNWNDFTGNMDAEFWDGAFAQLAEDDINCTRIWINCAGESIIRLKTTGEIKEIREGHWTDLDKLFEMAEKHGVYVMATLTSFDHFKEPNAGYDKWRNLVSSKELTDAYADTYVAEFCKRYGSNEYLFAIDLMNEPDWVHENAECGQLDWNGLSYFFGKCAATIHENSDTLVTVGFGMVRYNSDKYEGNIVSDEHLKEVTGNDKAYVDFYSPHFYMWEKPYFGFPYSGSPTDFGLDGTKPTLLGEASNDDEKESKMTLTEEYKAAYDNGWNGVMVWMDPVEEDYSWYRYDLTRTATNAMYDYIPDKIYPIGKKAAAETAAE